MRSKEGGLEKVDIKGYRQIIVTLSIDTNGGRRGVMKEVHFDRGSDLYFLNKVSHRVSVISNHSTVP